MEQVQERLTIQITEEGVLMADHEGNRLSFTAGEALMLLDILKAEEAQLRDMAGKASPLPTRVPL